MAGDGKTLMEVFARAREFHIRKIYLYRSNSNSEPVDEGDNRENDCTTGRSANPSRG